MAITIGNGKKLATLMGVMLLSGFAWGQQAAKDDAAGIPTPQSGSSQGIPLGPITAYPSINYSLKHDSNIYAQPTKTSDTIHVIKPGVRFEGKQAENVYSLNLGAEDQRYARSGGDSVTNYNTLGEAKLRFGTRLGANLRAEHIDSHDPRGSVPGAIPTVPSHYRQSYLGGIVSYGAPGAQGRVELELGSLEKRYLNNRAATSLNDRDATDIGGTFFWRVMPKTSLLMQAKHTNNSYMLAGSTLDSTDSRILAGVTWEATAATTGIFKVGRLKKDFKNAAQQDYGSANWEGQVRWSPRTYSTVDLATAKTARETASGLGSSILGSTYTAKWTHAWNSQVSSEVSGGYATDVYKGTTRDDKSKNLGLKMTYQMRRWLNFGAELTHINRDSSDNTADFKRNAFLLFVNATL